MWTLEEAVTISRRIEDILIPLGYHCSLGGSVLHKGTSSKDVDIFVYPHDSQNLRNEDDLMFEIFSKLRGNYYGDCDDQYQKRDSKTVKYMHFDYFEPINSKEDELWMDTSNRRIDIFFLK